MSPDDDGGGGGGNGNGGGPPAGKGNNKLSSSLADDVSSSPPVFVGLELPGNEGIVETAETPQTPAVITETTTVAETEIPLDSSTITVIEVKDFDLLADDENGSVESNFESLEIGGLDSFFGELLTSHLGVLPTLF